MAGRCIGLHRWVLQSSAVVSPLRQSCGHTCLSRSHPQLCGNAADKLHRGQHTLSWLSKPRLISPSQHVIQKSQFNLYLNQRVPSHQEFPAQLFSTTAAKPSVGSSDSDSSSSKGELVYKGSLSGMIKGVKIFSVSTSLMGLALQPYLYMSGAELPLALKIAMGGIVNFFIFINPFIIHYIAMKYVTDVRWNRRTGVFTAARYSFFVRRREMQFSAADVRVPDVPGMFTVLEAKGTPLFLVPQDYLSQDAYVHLMGFDKPLDWELPRRHDDQEGEIEGEEERRAEKKGRARN